MINEVEEFICYTGEAAYTAAGKKDLSWMCRLPFNMLKDFEGFGRVLTVVARGFLFVGNEPASERARRALCAWCSIPEDPDAPKKDWEYRSGFPELSEEFPTLTDSVGSGWLYRHVQGMTGFVKAHPELVAATAIRNSQELEESFAGSWRKKVRQLQVPLFSLTREAAWGMSFDSVVADALELGPLRPWEVEFPESETERLHGLVPDVRMDRAARFLLAFYYANKPEDSEWVVLPVTNFDAYLQTTSFSRKWLPALDGLLIERSAQSYGISRYKPLENWDISFREVL